MGLTPSRSWYMYGRDHQDYWLSKPLELSIARETDVLFHIGLFKHQVLLMALDLAHVNVSKLYLYNGWQRVAKCEKTDRMLFITFTDSAKTELWSTCTRSRLQNLFDHKWKPMAGACLTFERSPALLPRAR